MQAARRQDANSAAAIAIWNFRNRVRGGGAMSGKSKSILSIIVRALGALSMALALTGAAFAQQPLRIGFGMSLTGPLAGNGKAALIAMEIWRDDVNAKGGILGRKV